MIEGQFRAFAMRSGDEDAFRLRMPASFRFPAAEGMAQRFATAEIGNLEISGSGGRGSLAKEAGGPLELRVSGLSLNRLNAWMEKALPDVAIREMNSKLFALSPEVRGSIDLSLEEARPLGLVRMELENMELGSRVSIDGLELSLNGAVVLRASGALPFSIFGPDGEDGPQVQVAREGEIDFRAETLVGAPLAAVIAQWTGLEVDTPELEIDLGGTMEKPEGKVSLRAGLIDFERFRFGPDLEEPLPVLRDFHLRLTTDGQRLEIERLEALIRGGQIEGSGDWPIPEGLWSGLAEMKSWEKHLLPGRFELSFADWEVEDWTPYLPKMLRRSGLLNGALRYRPEAGLSGFVSFDELALRPTQNFPAVDSIRGEFRVDDQLLTLTDARARVGGSPVSMDGELNLTAWPRAKWEIGLSGENIPIVRRTDMILRSDIEVALKSGTEPGAAELSGRLDLRSSTMLVEFDPLSPPTESGPSTTPPFFEVDEAPFSRWGLDLRIEGERFLRVRSPYFQSLVSAGFDLSGTLGQPLLIGGIRLGDGHLSFPGAKLKIDSGEAYIEAAAPNTLRLDVTGTARTGAHVISMQVGGSVAEPQIQFASSPPLPKSSIVRLLSTGSATGGGGGSVGLYLGRGLLGAGGMGERLSDRLTIDVGQETTRSGRSALGLRYDLNEKWSLQSEYDIYDSYNMDLLWTIFKR